MTGIRRAVLQPAEVAGLRFDDFPGGTIADVVAWMRAREPGFLAALVADIRVNGLADPVALSDGGLVWDGHHRLAAAWVLQVPVPAIYATGEGWEENEESEEAKARGRYWRDLREDRFPDEWQARMEHNPAVWGRRHAQAAERKAAGLVRNGELLR